MTTKEKNYSLAELRLWIEGREKAQIDWRLNPKNMEQLSIMVAAYAATPGGKSSGVTSRLRAERRRAQIAQETEEKALKQRETLESAIHEDFLLNAGLETDRQKNQAEIVKEYALSGRGRDVQRRIEAEKRSKAARTF